MKTMLCDDPKVIALAVALGVPERAKGWELSVDIPSGRVRVSVRNHRVEGFSSEYQYSVHFDGAVVCHDHSMILGLEKWLGIGVNTQRWSLCVCDHDVIKVYVVGLSDGESELPSLPQCKLVT